MFMTTKTRRFRSFTKVAQIVARCQFCGSKFDVAVRSIEHGNEMVNVNGTEGIDGK
jgi:hypothetical protein